MRLTPTELRQAIAKAYCDKNSAFSKLDIDLIEEVVQHIITADLEKFETLRDYIASAINRCSAENGSSTPDFILAGFLTDCLAAFDRTVAAREQWYGRPSQPVPGVRRPSPWGLAGRGGGTEDAG